MKWKMALPVWTLLFSGLSFADGSEGSLLVDDSSFRSIFEATQDESRERAENLSEFEFEPGVFLRSVGDLKLSNDYFDVSYSEAFQTLPSFQIGIGFSPGEYSGFRMYPAVSVGYAYHEGLMSVHSVNGVAFSDFMRLHWFNAGLGAKISRTVPGASFLAAFIHPSLGVQLLSQTGVLDGISQGFWLPYYELGGGVNLFGQSRGRSWFGGVDLSLARSSGFSSEQAVGFWKTGLSLRVIL